MIEHNKHNVNISRVEPDQTFDRPDAMVDVALFTLSKGKLCVGLMKRAPNKISPTPYEGELALLGAYIHIEENADSDTDDTAKRLLREKAGLVPPHLEQLYTFSGRFRDPRRWSLSVAYYGLVPESHLYDACKNGLVLAPVDEIASLPFDHNKIIDKGVQRLRSKSAYSTLPIFLLPLEFTMAELHEVYQQVMGVDIPLVTFRRKIEAQEIIRPLKGKMKTGKHRPAQLYTRKAKTLKTFDETF